MGKEPKKGLKLIGLDIQNRYRIRAARLEFSPEGGITEITGDNKSGKTSLARTILDLFGIKGKRPADPRNDEAGEDEPSRVVATFTEGYRLKRKSTPANPLNWPRHLAAIIRQSLLTEF